jgi:large subunit ribosomal protein L9
MKIILNTKLKNHKPGDIIDVKDGYGTYLINNGDAVLATTGNITHLNTTNAENALQEELHIKDMEDVKKKIEKEKIVFKVKTGDKDQVFGSVTTKKIAEYLNKHGYQIDKKKISLDHDLVTLGTHLVDIELHKKVHVQIKVELVKER